MGIKKSKNKSYEIKFWRDWLQADTLRRCKLVEKLSIVRDIRNTNKLPQNIKRHVFAQLLNSYFEDLEDTIRAKPYASTRKKNN